MGTAPVAAWKWGVVWLLFFATVINYMDRQTVTALAGPLKAAFTSDQSAPAFDRLFDSTPGPDGRRHLSNAGYGAVDSAFGYTFATFQIIAGFLVDRRSLRWLYAGALVVWSAAGFATGLVTTVEMLLVCRIVLGMGEAFNWPAAVATIQRIVPREHRSLANGIFHSGASIGAILTPLLVLAMVGETGAGWQRVFLVVGGVGVVWAAVWLGTVRGERAAAVDQRPAVTAGDGPAETFLSTFAGRRMWITLAVGISVNVFWHFCRVWLPPYLDKDLGLGFKAAGGTTISLPWGTWVLTSATAGLLIQSAFYIAADIGALLTGYVTRRLIQAGRSVEVARKLVMLGTAGLCLLAVPAVAVGRTEVAVPLLLLVAAGAMGGFANYFALVQDVSPRNTALVSGFAGAMAWYVIAILNPVIGGLADRLGTFVPLFQVVCFMPLIGALAGLLWPSAAKNYGT